mgnify:FL=1
MSKPYFELFSGRVVQAEMLFQNFAVKFGSLELVDLEFQTNYLHSLELVLFITFKSLTFSSCDQNAA